MKWSLILFMSAIMILAGCNDISPDITTKHLRLSTYITGQEFVQSVIDSIEDDSGWKPPLPPEGGEKPRLLTAEEKEVVLAKASTFYAVAELKQNKDITSVLTRYLWIGWIGHADGESCLDYEPIENNTISAESIAAMGDKCYPAVSFIFNSKFGDSGITGIHIAINLESGKIVFVGGFNASKIMPTRIPPPLP